jgi:hypothetical protein
MSLAQTGQRCRASSTPPFLPADEKGWQGQESVQTGRSSRQRARRSASDHVPIPAKKWHWS